MAAWRLAEAGFDVVVLEGNDTIGEPVRCGEALSLFALENNQVPVSDEFIVRYVDGIRIISPDGTMFKVVIPGICIRRDLFDRYLIDKARIAGAEILTGSKVMSSTYDEHWTLVTEGGATQAKVMVAADGPRSNIGRSLGMDTPTRIANAVQYRFNISDALANDHLNFYVGQRYTGGYGWYFDRGSEVSIGVISTGRPRPLLDALCIDLGIDPEARVSMSGGLIPQSGPNKVISGRTMVTVGDAAGLVNPCSAGGIHSAMHSGRVAAQHIAEALARGHPIDVRGYEQDIRSSPFCDPVLLEARQFMDDLTDEQWDYIISSVRDMDMSRLIRFKVLSRIITQSPFTTPQIWSLRAIGKAFKSYGTWGW
jgi:digeranylgeranylglycerophospholipid reductase